jgi:hypothetical protein
VTFFGDVSADCKVSQPVKQRASKMTRIESGTPTFRLALQVAMSLLSIILAL